MILLPLIVADNSIGNPLKNDVLGLDTGFIDINKLVIVGLLAILNILL